MSKLVKNIIIISIILSMLLLLTKGCKGQVKDKIITSLGGYTKQDYKETIDTLESRFDSIYIQYDSIRTLAQIGEQRIINDFKVPIVKNNDSSTSAKTPSFKGNGKESLNKITKKDSVFTSLYTQINPISDTLIDGFITSYINTSNCKIVSQSLNYKPKFPIIVKEYITVEKTIEKTLSNKKQTYIGGGVTLTSDKDIGLLGAYQFSNKIQIQGGYTWGINKDFNSIPNNNKVSISLLKLF